MGGAKHLYSTKNIPINERHQIALQAMRHDQQITELAAQKQVSRDFIYAQKNKALQAITTAFQPANDDEVLFYLPITKKWITSFILCLILHCRACHRGIYKLFKDAFDYELSLGTIHNIVQVAAATAKNINAQQDLKSVTIAAHDELFHNDKPILAGIDIPTLYCYLLAKENSRCSDTWAIHFLDLQKRKFKPNRVIADDGSGLRAGHSLVLWNIPCDIDNFHVTRDLMDLRRYFRNKLKTAITWRIECETKSQTAIREDTMQKYANLLPSAIEEEQLMQYLTTNIATLVSWMEHDVLNKPGPNIIERRELFNFIVTEFEVLAKVHPHRIEPICVKLEDARDLLLGFVDVLEEKFTVIAKQYQCSIDLVWEICKLQRCKYMGDQYLERSENLVLESGDAFEDIEDAVLLAMDTTERTSSMVENLNSRIRPYLFVKKNVEQNFLELLRFYFNHTPFLRSARGYRVNKTPAELLNGEHNHWLEMLGFSKFKRAA